MSPETEFPRVLVLHNRYRFRGGEDSVVDEETALLRAHGHAVTLHLTDNEFALSRGRWATLRALAAGAWSPPSYEAARALCRETRPTVAHVHNFWFRLSPSVLAACRDEGVPVALSLHNFRLVCAGALLLRDGRPCEDCVGRAPWRGVWHRCYQNSFLASAAVARMMARGRGPRGTWATAVDRYLVPSEWARQVFLRAGFDPERIGVLPGFAPAPAAAAGPASPRAPGEGLRVVYLGRLSAEKGLICLLDAWEQARLAPGATLTLAGDGPLASLLARRAAAGPRRVVLTGQLARERALGLLHGADALVLPSECYETFGLVIIEAFAHGVPVIATRLGGVPALLEEGEAGLLFPAGDRAALAHCLETVQNDADLRRRLAGRGLVAWRERFAATRHYESLIDGYRAARRAFDLARATAP
ncbi:MAG: glycosyltransferase family 4 protein [Planctomycetes bacterium]|nr:glycosyltransferase family 4 protein [Planctomycetota bacterium]